MDESGSVDGSEGVDGEARRWEMAGLVLARKAPAVFVRLLEMVEATAAELSTVDETFIG